MGAGERTAELKGSCNEYFIIIHITMSKLESGCGKPWQAYDRKSNDRLFRFVAEYG
jgi:hypothetical protein